MKRLSTPFGAFVLWAADYPTTVGLHLHTIPYHLPQILCHHIHNKLNEPEFWISNYFELSSLTPVLLPSPKHWRGGGGEVSEGTPVTICQWHVDNNPARQNIKCVECVRSTASERF